MRALEKTGGVRKTAANLLGISGRAIDYKANNFDIDVSVIRSREKKLPWLNMAYKMPQFGEN